MTANPLVTPAKADMSNRWTLRLTVAPTLRALQSLAVEGYVWCGTPVQVLGHREVRAAENLIKDLARRVGPLSPGSSLPRAPRQ